MSIIEKGTARTRAELQQLHCDLCAEARQLMDAKNRDYAAESDPYRNFRQFGRYGILVRLSDKLARLRTFEERGEFSVKDESVLDTCKDVINYIVLYLGYSEETYERSNDTLDSHKGPGRCTP